LNVIAALEYTNEKFLVVIDKDQYIYKLDRGISGKLVKNPSSR
jgi:hypothetical protein